MRAGAPRTQLCVLDPELWPLAVRSISDWKNVYMPECAPCVIRDRCGGFLASAVHRNSAHIRPFDSQLTAGPSTHTPGSIRRPAG